MGISASELFDELGEDYETAYAGLPARLEDLDWLLAHLPAGARVLDVGSGTGRPTAEVLAAAGHDVTGWDVSPHMVEIARAQVPAARFEVADVRALTCPDGSWHAITAFFSLLQMPRADIDATLARFVDWLAPGGYLLLATVPVDIDGVEIEFMGRPGVVVSSYPTEVFRRRLTDLGLQIVRERIIEFRADHDGADLEHDLFLIARKPA